MPKKRAATVHRMRGDGTIYYLKVRNQWVGLLNLGTDPLTGKRKRVSVAAATPEEVSLKLAQLRADHAKGEAVVVARDLLGDWLDRWFTVFHQPFVKANTAKKTQGNIHRIRTGPLARMPIGEVTHERVQGWINKMADTYAEATIVTTLSTLSMALEKLVEQKRLSLNPAEHVRIPKKARRAEEARAMDEETMKRLIEAARKTKYAAPILFMLHTGLRAGEMSALDIGDYKPMIKVSKTWSNGLNAVQQEAKTASSNRSVPRPKALDDLMTTYMFKLHRKSPTDPLFQTATYPYTRLRPGHLDGVVGRIADSIGEPWITPHTLRHTFASTMLRKGIRINVVSKLLGHKDVATTYRIYIHMIPEEMDEAVDTVGKVMMGG